jgi:hypothetical protein
MPSINSVVYVTGSFENVIACLTLIGRVKDSDSVVWRSPCVGGVALIDVDDDDLHLLKTQTELGSDGLNIIVKGDNG